MSDRKAVIKNADMSEDMQQDAVECATQALEKYNIEKDIAAYIKKVKLNRKHFLKAQTRLYLSMQAKSGRLRLFLHSTILCIIASYTPCLVFAIVSSLPEETCSSRTVCPSEASCPHSLALWCRERNQYHKEFGISDFLQLFLYMFVSDQIFYLEWVENVI